MAPTTQERRKAGTGIDSFTAQKGITRSIRDYKHRQDTKMGKKAALLREYSKVMKKEGMEVGRGAGRRRRDGDDGDDNNNDDSRKQRKPRQNPFTKSLQKYNERKEAEKQEQVQYEQSQTDKEKKQKQRKRQSKLQSQRTKKGQPVMKHMISGLLSRIEEKSK
jgi:hypothetical protein